MLFPAAPQRRALRETAVALWLIGAWTGCNVIVGNEEARFRPLTPPGDDASTPPPPPPSPIDVCAVEGAACDGGSCTRGVCRTDVYVSQNLDLSTDSVSVGRGCAESIAFSVVALTSTTAKTEGPVAAGCFLPGDEVLLINLQGAAGMTANLGVYENLRVKRLDSDVVTFDAPKTRFFGDAAESDANIGIDAGQQKVMLMRVPNFGKLTVPAGMTITSAAWDGRKGGVIAFRTNALVLDGMIDARALGYRPGRGSQGDSMCDDSVTTEAGESIVGPAKVTTQPNGGGSGGIGAATNVSYLNDPPLNASAGHASAGQGGANFKTRAAGAPGAAYGVADGTRLTMGSGGGGPISCVPGTFGPRLIPGGRPGGGIVAMFGGDITVNPGGSIDVRPPSSAQTAPSAGYVYLRGNAINIGEALVRATKVEAIATRSAGNLRNYGSEGRIAIWFKTSISGKPEPAAFVQQTPDP